VFHLTLSFTVNRWLSIRFQFLAYFIVGTTALISVLDARIDASFAGFCLAFAKQITPDLLIMVSDRFASDDNSYPYFCSVLTSQLTGAKVYQFGTVDGSYPPWLSTYHAHLNQGRHGACERIYGTEERGSGNYGPAPSTVLALSRCHHMQRSGHSIRCECISIKVTYFITSGLAGFAERSSSTQL
jgi:hypothetical protein